MARKTYTFKVTSPEKIEQIEKSNKKLIERYLKYLSQTRSQGTIKVYKSNFDIFFCWNLDYNDNKPFEKIKKIEMQDFFSFCSDTLKFSPNRFSNMHSSLSSLSTYVENQLDELDEYKDFRNIVAKITKPVSEPVRKKTIIKPEQINQLIEMLLKESEEDEFVFQEALYVALSVSMGTRVSETLRVTTDLIDEKSTAFDGLFLVTTEPIRTKGRGKNGKSLYKYIIKDFFLPLYKKWLTKRKKLIKKTKADDHNSIFIKRDGTPATVTTVQRWTIKWSELLNLDIYTHSFRHYFVTYLSRIGLEPELIQSIVGWSSFEMINVYNDLRVDEREWKGLEKLKSVLNVATVPVDEETPKKFLYESRDSRRMRKELKE